MKPGLLPDDHSTASSACRRKPTSFWSKAPAARPRSICAPTTSPTWASPGPADVPVILIGDIDRGGVIAQIVGTQAVLDPADAALIAGFLVNKFRGDPALFRPGMDFIAERTGWPGLGLIRYFPRRRPASRGRRGRAGQAAGRERRDRSPWRFLAWRISPISTISIRFRLEPSLRVVMVEPGQRVAGRCRAGHPARLQGDDRGPGGFPAERLGYRSARACPPRRTRPGHLRRLPDARQSRGRSGWDRGPSRQRARASACSMSRRY